jgi:CRP-like cAMP-binding protein
MYDNLRQIISSVTTITDSDWSMIEPFLSIKQYHKNEFHLIAGEVEKKLGLIVNGSFRWYYLNSKGEEVNFHFFFENSFVVEYQSFISQYPSQMYIQAMEDATVVLMPERDKIFDLYSKSHNWSEMGRKIAQLIYVQTAYRVQDLLFKSAEDRYISLIKQHPDIFKRVSLSNISSYIGIKGPSLSRIRKRISVQ